MCMATESAALYNIFIVFHSITMCLYCLVFDMCPPDGQQMDGGPTSQPSTTQGFSEKFHLLLGHALGAPCIPHVEQPVENTCSVTTVKLY